MQEATQMNNNTQIQERKPSFMSEMLGQFATRKFWKEMAKLVLQEVLAAVLVTGGGMLVWYGKQKRNHDTPDKAFGGNSFRPTPSYQPSSSYPVPSAPPPDRFPGF